MPRNHTRAHDLDLSIVVPLFNESGTFNELHRRLTEVLLVLGLDSEIIYVDDGSTDGTREALAAVGERDPRVRVVNLARNYGQTAALAAGFDAAGGQPLDAPPAVEDGQLADSEAVRRVAARLRNDVQGVSSPRHQADPSVRR